MDRLMKVREYHAMFAVEKLITEISEVLGGLASGEGSAAASAVAPETPEAPRTKANVSAAVADHLATALGLGPIDQQISKPSPCSHQARKGINSCLSRRS